MSERLRLRERSPNSSPIVTPLNPVIKAWMFIWNDAENLWHEVTVEAHINGVLNILEGTNEMRTHQDFYDFWNITYGAGIQRCNKFPKYMAEGCTIEALFCIPPRVEADPSIENLYFNGKDLGEMMIFWNVLRNVYIPPNALPVQSLEQPDI